ncbi:hypothetical protein [Qipengyuania spongiae]|uniref:PRC-barrel domain containing protein n=1 Tax=Qipengyuania spongiae TaxID=2909673 RepID=A0ABY5SXR1_9SPHN|nr:hypothetical protein [Qipengyuania spongiae]UVI39322.1 hypothetical protein L1F33_14015 [Qipengyuania spongiae]
MLDFLQWYGAIAAVVAALVVASNVSTRVSGWAFVLFVSSSASLIAWGFLSEDAEGIGWQNICLLAINLWGVYRYLIRGDPTGRDADPNKPAK